MKLLDMILNEKQREGLRALRNTEFTKYLFDGGIRSGKTVLILLWMICRAIAYPKSIQIIIRKEAKQHRRGIWGQNNTVGTMFHWLFDQAGLGLLYELRESDMRIMFWNGSEIRFEGVDTPEKVGRIYGSEYITMWFNEARDIDYDVVTGLQGRVAQKVNIDPMMAGRENWFPEIANPQIIFDTNPAGKRHWLYKAGVMKLDPKEGGMFADAANWCRVGGWKPWDNEANINTEMISAQTGIDRKRYLDGEWCDNEGAVYQEFNEDVHVCRLCDGKRCRKVWANDRRLIANRIFRGIDFGWNDPTVCLWGADIAGQVLIYRCYYQTQTTTAKNAENILAMQNKFEPIAWTVIDHQPEYAAQLRKAGIHNRNAKKDKPIMGGIDRVKKRLAVVNDRAGLMVCQHCTPVLEEMASYMMNARKDEPEDKDNHCMDALRYIVSEIDGKRKSRAWIF